MKTLRWGQTGSILALVVILLTIGTTALAAEFVNGETVRVGADEVIDDDFYATGGEIVVDGTVDGDLVVAGGYIELNGTVTGDLIAAGGGIVVNGRVEDDVRIAGGGLTINGSIGDDLVAAGGGGFPGMAAVPFGTGDRTVPPGVHVTAAATVGGDALLAGGEGTMDGTVAGDLKVGMGTFTLGGQVGGDVSIEADTLQIAPAARVAGTLHYATRSDVTVPPETAAKIEVETLEIEQERGWGDWLLRWLLRTVQVLIGTLLVAALLWRFVPRLVETPVNGMTQRPAESLLFGLLVLLLGLLLAAPLVFLAVLFWGWLPGGAAMFTLLFGIGSFLWLLSPAVTGLWLGRLLVRASNSRLSDLWALLIGTALIVLAGRLLLVVPCVGELAYRVLFALSLALALGGLFVVRWPRRAAADAKT